MIIMIITMAVTMNMGQGLFMQRRNVRPSCTLVATWMRITILKYFSDDNLVVTDHHYDDDDDEEDDESESVPDEEEAPPRLHFAP